MVNSNNILENSDLFDIINKSIKNRIPSSFIRKGDGENIVIGYNRLKEIDYKQYKRIMRIMNVKLKNRSLQQFIIDELFSAFNNCNVLGISKIEQRYNFWAIENNILELLNFDSNQYCDMNFHMDFVKYPRENKIRNEVAREIISNKNLGIISCFNVKDFLFHHNSKLVKWIKMPIQNNLFGFGYKITLDFYYNAFSEIKKHNDKIDVWLIGAGIHGKIFCNQIKKNNGIAIDIGSAIDSWKNIYNSRGYLKKIIKNSKFDNNII